VAGGATICTAIGVVVGKGAKVGARDGARVAVGAGGGVPAAVVEGDAVGLAQEEAKTQASRSSRSGNLDLIASPHDL
jgi:hypothetical protein